MSEINKNTVASTMGMSELVRYVESLQSQLQTKDALIKELEGDLKEACLSGNKYFQQLEVLTKCTCTTHDLNIGDDCIGCHNKKLIEGEK